jgi:salicylate hydroxylase
MRIAIIGGGIGGLSAALFLQRTFPQAEFAIFEKARKLGEVGAGIQLSPNATRLLARVGVLADLEALAVRPLRSHQRRWRDGSIIATNPMGEMIEKRFGAPYLHLHRADLISVLARHVGERLPSGSLRLGTTVTGLSNDDGQVTLVSGAVENFDLVVGADGIHSVTRSHVLGEVPPARYSGHVAYRALIANSDDATGAPLLADPEVNIWLGPGAHVVQYLLRRSELINLVVVLESSETVSESWSEVGDPMQLRAAFAGWDPSLRRLLDRVEETMRWALHDHQPLDRWVRGHVCLLGDSAHPMLPYLAQGGAQSIEDAAALASSVANLSSGSDAFPDQLDDALRSYQGRRLARTSAIQLSARDLGTTNHLPDGDAQRERDERLLQGPGRRAAGGLDLYGHDAEEEELI